MTKYFSSAHEVSLIRMKPTHGLNFASVTTINILKLFSFCWSSIKNSNSFLKIALTLVGSDSEEWAYSHFIILNTWNYRTQWCLLDICESNCFFFCCLLIERRKSHALLFQGKLFYRCFFRAHSFDYILRPMEWRMSRKSCIKKRLRQLNTKFVFNRGENRSKYWSFSLTKEEIELFLM